jgi:phage terminase large subunit-like protein
MDELHAWPKRELWEALKTGLIKTAGSLNVIITTAGRGQTSIAHEQRSSSGSTLRKVLPGSDCGRSFFAGYCLICVRAFVDAS